MENNTADLTLLPPTEESILLQIPPNEEPIGKQLTTIEPGYHPADFNVGQHSLKEAPKVNDNIIKLNIGSKYLLRNDTTGTLRNDYIATFVGSASSVDAKYLLFYVLYYRYRRFNESDPYNKWEPYIEGHNPGIDLYFKLDQHTQDELFDFVKNELQTGKAQFTTKNPKIDKYRIFLLKESYFFPINLGDGYTRQPNIRIFDLGPYGNMITDRNSPDTIPEVVSTIDHLTLPPKDNKASVYERLVKRSKTPRPSLPPEIVGNIKSYLGGKIKRRKNKTNKRRKNKTNKRRKNRTNKMKK